MRSCGFFEFLQLRLDCPFVFGGFQSSHQFEAFAYRTRTPHFAGLVSQCGRQVALARKFTQPVMNRLSPLRTKSSEARRSIWLRSRPRGSV